MGLIFSIMNNSKLMHGRMQLQRVLYSRQVLQRHEFDILRISSILVNFNDINIIRKHIIHS